MQTMRSFSAVVLLSILASPLMAPAADQTSAQSDKIRLLVITGGHAFEKEPFFKLFKDNADVTFEAVEQPAAQAHFKAEAAKQYDVIVMYDYGQKISDESKADFIARLKEGKGLVVLHHAIVSYPDWPEYWKIIGSHYYLAKTNINGVEKPRSGYKHDMEFKIHVVDPKHPVTRGVKDYEIHDETYKWFDIFVDCLPLLTTDEPESNKVIAWAKTYDGARVVYMQSGHDHFAYENPNFQQILKQAIRWTAKKD
jgi:type 1 glutamine amidotransferase